MNISKTKKKETGTPSQSRTRPKEEKRRGGVARFRTNARPKVGNIRNVSRKKLMRGRLFSKNQCDSGKRGSSRTTSIRKSTKLDLRPGERKKKKRTRKAKASRQFELAASAKFIKKSQKKIFRKKRPQTKRRKITGDAI